MHETINTIVPLGFTYNNRVGQYMERFIKGLGQKKIMGVTCPKCKKTYVPPRSVCGTCYGRLEKWVEVSQEGTLQTYTVGHVTIDNGEIKDAPSPYILGAVKLKNAFSLLTAVVKGAQPDQLKPGLKVRAVWKEPPEESYASLDHFEVVGAALKRKR